MGYKELLCCWRHDDFDAIQLSGATRDIFNTICIDFCMLVVRYTYVIYIFDLK